jgi:tRNA(adenine34) deaminase
MKFDNSYMKEAMELARRAADSGEVPVGAVIIDATVNKIIASAFNQVENSQNPCAHAEMLAIDTARKKLNSKFLSKCDLYVTLEPCPMCAHAISLTRIKRLFFAAEDQKGGGVINGPVVFSSSSCHHKPEIYDGICSEESSHLLKKFFKIRR